MIGLFARLFALRPLLSFALLGVPVFVLVAIGLATVVALKLLFFVVLPDRAGGLAGEVGVQAAR